MQMHINRTSQAVIARLAGSVLLVSIALGVFSAFYGPEVLAAPAFLEQITAGASEPENIFRLNIAFQILLAIAELFVAAAFYVLLEPVGKFIALFMVLLRVASAATQIIIVLVNFILLRALTSGGQDLITPDQLPALTTIVQAVQLDAAHLGLIFSSSGALFAFYLFFQSTYIPKIISGWGVLASLGVVFSIFAIRLAPDTADLLYPGYVLGNLIAFILLTFWLLFFGVKTRDWERE